MSDEETDLDMEQFLALSDAEQDKLLQHEFDRFCAWFDSLSPLEQYRWNRSTTLDTIRLYRKLIRTSNLPFLHLQLRQCQARLVTHRQVYYSRYTSPYLQ